MSRVMRTLDAGHLRPEGLGRGSPVPSLTQA